MTKGFLTVARFRGIPLRIHWTMPLCALVAGRLKFVPALWLGFLLLVLIHEFGHAAVVRAHRLRVLSVDILGIGGLCHWSGDATPMQRATIAWGGVWAQMLLWALATGAVVAFGPPETAFTAQLAEAFTSVNAWLMLVNLLPIKPLDGAEAWPLVGMLWKRRRRTARKMPRPIAHLISVPRHVQIRETVRKEESAFRTLDEDDDDPLASSPEVEELLARVREIAAREGELETSLRVGRKSGE